MCSSDLEVMEMNVPFGLGRKWRRLEQLGHEPRFAASWRAIDEKTRRLTGLHGTLCGGEVEKLGY